VDAWGAVAGDGKGHRFVVFALMDAEAGAGPEAEVHEKSEELGILFVDAHYLVGTADFGFRKAQSTMFAAEFLHAAEKRDAVGAAAVAAEAFEQQFGDFGRDSVLEAFGFFVSAGPFEADYVSEQFLCEAVAQDEVLGRIDTKLVDQAVFLWIVHDVWPIALSPRVKGFVHPQSWYVDFSPVTVE